MAQSKLTSPSHCNPPAPVNININYWPNCNDNAPRAGPLRDCPDAFGDPGASSSRAPPPAGPTSSVPPAPPPDVLYHGIIKPAQGRKTFECFRIREHYFPDSFVLHITQPRKNDGDQLYERDGERDRAVLLHSGSSTLKDRGFAETAEGLALALELERVKVIMALANTPQLRRVLGAMKLLWTRPEVRREVRDRKWVVFVDEGDKTYGGKGAFCRDLEAFVEEYFGKLTIYLVTATLPADNDRLWARIGSLRIHPNFLGMEGYSHLRDAQWHAFPMEVDKYEDVAGLVVRALDLHSERAPDARAYGFVPTDFRVRDHRGTAGALLRAEWSLVVVVLNGEGVTVHWKKEEEGSRRSRLVGEWEREAQGAGEVSKCISRRFSAKGCRLLTGRESCRNVLCGCTVKTDLDAIKKVAEEYGDRPVVVTGKLCLLRGSTLHDEDMPFSFCVASGHLLLNKRGRKVRHEAFRHDLYQLIGRVSGSFPMAPPIVVYSDEDVKTWVCQEERLTSRIGGMDRVDQKGLRRLREAVLAEDVAGAVAVQPPRPGPEEVNPALAEAMALDGYGDLSGSLYDFGPVVKMTEYLESWGDVHMLTSVEIVQAHELARDVFSSPDIVEMAYQSRQDRDNPLVKSVRNWCELGDKDPVGFLETFRAGHSHFDMRREGRGWERFCRAFYRPISNPFSKPSGYDVLIIYHKYCPEELVSMCDEMVAWHGVKITGVCREVLGVEREASGGSVLFDPKRGVEIKIFAGQPFDRQ